MVGNEYLKSISNVARSPSQFQLVQILLWLLLVIIWTGKAEYCTLFTLFFPTTVLNPQQKHQHFKALSKLSKNKTKEQSLLAAVLSDVSIHPNPKQPPFGCREKKHCFLMVLVISTTYRSTSNGGEVFQLGSGLFVRRVLAARFLRTGEWSQS